LRNPALNYLHSPVIYITMKSGENIVAGKQGFISMSNPLGQIEGGSFLDYMTDGFLTLDFHWRYTYVNIHAARLCGRTPEEMTGKTFLECFPEARDSNFYAAFHKAMHEKTYVHIEEYFLPWKRWFDVHIYPVPGGIVVFFHETTERRIAEQELKNNQLRIKEIKRLANIGSWEWDAQTETLTCSETLGRIFGYEPVVHVGDFANFMMHVYPEDRPELCKVRGNALQDRKSWDADYRILRLDGDVRHIHEHGIVPQAPDGKIAKLFGYAQDITSLRHTEQALSESEDLFRSVFEQAAVGITLTQLNGRYAKVNEKFASLLGYTVAEMMQRDFQSITYPDDLAADLALVDQLLGNECTTYSMEKRFLHKSGAIVWSNLTASLRRDKNGEPLHFIAVMEDITVRKETERRLQQQKQLTEFIVDALPLNVFLKDERGRYVMFNEEAARTAGISKEQAIGKTDFDLFPEEAARIILDDDRYVRETNDVSLREIPITFQGKERTVLAGKKFVNLGDGPPRMLGFSIDITDRKQSERRVQFLASHDALTGLPNRSLLHDRLEHAIALAQRSGRMVAVLFLDLDRFKLINDSFGHKSGDELLQVMAGRLRQAIRAGDTAARLGGDEFVVLLEELESEDEASHIAVQILAKMLQPVALNDQEFVISTSIGISLYPKDHHNAETLLKDADIAMYHAKADGGNTFRYFAGQMNALAFQRLATENRLRKAVEGEQLVLHYQPLVDLATGNIIGMEALMRWNDPVRGLVAPDQFFAIAEESGLIVGLCQKVLHEACKQHCLWEEKGWNGLQMSVNLSAQQFGPLDLVETVKAVLDETGMQPTSLKLEITETELMQDVARAKETLHELAGMGIELAIDDFGTGYSSLSYLKTLPIDTLKVDQSFVHDVVTDEDDAAIVRATIGLAHHMGLKVIAEGVESYEQLEFLKAHYCDIGQGYYFSPPLAAEAMEVLLARHTPFPLNGPI
jgi:diguanylate cyclase (GGDEF)-like protein/PAS domain S-box-containing protein